MTAAPHDQRQTHDELLAELRQQVLDLSRRHLLIRILRDLGLILSVVALAILVALVSFAQLQIASLRSILIFGGGGFAIVALTYLITLSRRLGHARPVTRLLGARDPALASDLLSTLELASTSSDADPPPFSPALFHGLVAQTWARLANLTPAHVVPVSTLRPAAVLLGTTALAWATTGTLAPETLDRLPRALAMSSLLDSKVATSPLVRDLRLTYRYPSYLRGDAPPRVVASSTGHISAPLGSRVDLTMRVKAKIRHLTLVVAQRGLPAKRQRVTQDQRQRLATTLRIIGEGHYYFEATLPSGERLRSPLTRRIDVQTDLAPKVTLFAPRDGIEVQTRQGLELAFVAEDDHGLKAIRLAYERAGSKTQRLALWPRRDGSFFSPQAASRPAASGPAASRPAAGPHAASRYAADKMVWDLSALNLARGGHVTYWIEAVDNDDVSGPKVTRSQARHLHAFSADERHDRNLTRQKQLLDRALRLLAPRSLLYAQPISAPVKRQRQLNQAGAAFTDAVFSLEAQMKPDPLVPRAVLETLSRIAKRLRHNSKAERQVLQAIAPGRQPLRGGARALKAANRRQTGEFERDALILANLLETQKLQQIAKAGQGIEETKRAISELLKRYEETHDPALHDRILALMKTLERQVDSLSRRLAKLSTTLPDEYLNREAITRLALKQRSAKLRDLFRQGKLKALKTALATLDDKLAAMRKLLSGNIQSFRDQRMSARERAYGEAMDRLHEIENEERAIGEGTAKIADRYRERVAKATRGRLRGRLAIEKRRLKKLRATLKALPEERLRGLSRSQRRRALRQAKWLSEAMAQDDLAQALKMAQRLNASLELLGLDLDGHRLGSLLGPPPRPADLRQLRRAQKLAAQIRDGIEAALPRPGDLLSPTSKRRLRSLEARQKSLAGRAARLREKLRQGSGPSPGPGLARGLRSAEKLMREARQELASLQPQRAHGAEMSAAGELASLRESMRRARQPRQSGRSARRQRIKIPGAEAFKATRAFRKDILDAMKEKAPATFEKPVRHYYHELVR